MARLARLFSEMNQVLRRPGEPICATGAEQGTPKRPRLLPARPAPVSTQRVPRGTASRAHRLASIVPAPSAAVLRGELSANEQATVRQPSKAQYSQFHEAFQKWSCDHFGARTTRPSSLVATRALAYLDGLFEARRAVGDAEKTIAAIKFFNPELKSPMSEWGKRLTSALSGFRKRAPPISRTGLPEDLLAGICNSMMLEGRHSVALEECLRFYGYLRPSKSRRLRVGDVLPPGPENSSVTVLLAPREFGVPTKTELFDEGVIIDHPSWLGPLLLTLAQGRPDDEPLFSASDADAEVLAAWKAAVRRMKLPGVVQYQLRHGGACCDAAARRRTPEEIRVRGRWGSWSTLARYMKPGAMQKMRRNLTPTVAKYNSDCLQVLGLVMRRARRPVLFPPLG